MAATITLEIVTPDGRKLKEDVEEFTARSTQGEFGVLPGHQPMAAALQTGLVTWKQAGELHSVAVGAGFVEVLRDKAVLLTDHFCRKEDVDPVRVRLELKQADEALDNFQGDPTSGEYVDLVADELWAAARLELYGDPPPPTIRTVYEFRGAEDFAKEASQSAETEEKP
jgi:F-type H+-transporting ATPase subunit epsilon